MLLEHITEQTFLFLIIGILIGAFIIWLLMRRQLQQQQQDNATVKQALAVESERVQQKDTRLDELKCELERSLSKNQSQQSDLEQYKINLAELNTTLLEERKQSEEKLLVEVLGVGGTQALQSIITDPNLTAIQKTNILVEVFGFTADIARKLVE